MATEAGTGTTTQEATAGPSTPITKGIILVHGMGDAKKGETLYRFFNPIVDYMTTRKRPAPRVTVAIPEDDSDDQPHASLEYPSEQKWHFVEAWWSKTVPEASADPAFGWTVTQAIRHVLGLVLSMIWQVPTLFLALFPAPFSSWAERLLGFTPVITTERIRLAVARVWARLLGRQEPDPGRYLNPAHGRLLWGTFGLYAYDTWSSDIQGVMQGMRDRPFTAAMWLWVLLAVYVPFQIVNTLLHLVLFGVGAALIAPLYLFLTIASPLKVVPGIGSAIAGARKPLDTFVIGSMGDIQVYLERPAEARRIRGEVEKAFDTLNELECTEIYLIAHSTGTPICYEVLVDREIAQKTRAARTLFSLGSIMRLAWRTPESHRPLLHRRINSVHPDVMWVNFHAAFDPAHPGPIEWEYRRINRIRAEIHCDELIEIPVTNENSTVNDHLTYESNVNQVIAAIVSDIWNAPDTAPEPFLTQNGASGRENDIERVRHCLLLGIPRFALLIMAPLLFWSMWLSADNVEAAEFSHKVVALIGAKGWADTHLAYPAVTTDHDLLVIVPRQPQVAIIRDPGQIEGVDSPFEWAMAVGISIGTVLLACYGIYLVYKNLYWERRAPRVYTHHDIP